MKQFYIRYNVHAISSLDSLPLDSEGEATVYGVIGSITFLLVKLSSGDLEVVTVD